MPDIELMGATYPDVPAVDLPKSGGGTARFYDPSGILYAGSNSSGGPAIVANGIHYGKVDSTSTSTKFTAQIPGITEYYDGLTILLKNGVVTSASGFTLDINGLGAKGSYSNLAAETRDTTIFNINYTMMFIYDSTRVAGGCWICYRGYDANTNTIGYQIRTNGTRLPMKSITYRYRLLFRSADGLGLVPANNSTSTNATTARTVCQDKIDPFGEIFYYGTTASVAAGSMPSASYMWQQYLVTLGYSFNTAGGDLTLDDFKPVYLKAAPQSDGSAIIDATEPYVQSLPSTEDSKIYIYLGIATDATTMELHLYHPVYYYKDGAIRPWINAVDSSEPLPVTSELLKGDNAGGAIAATGGVDYARMSDIPTINYPVTSVNTQTGAVVLSASDVNAIPTSVRGAANGVAPLNASSQIDPSYLPSYVDDVVEGYYNSTDGKFYEEDTYTTEIVPEAGKIYIDLSTNKSYRWGGTTYVEMPTGSTVSVSQSLGSGTEVGIITIDGTATTLYAPANTDTKVTQTKGTYSSYTYWRPVIMGSASNSSATNAFSTDTNTSYTFDNLRYQPSTGTLRTHIYNVAPTAAGTTASSNQMASDSVNNIYFKVNNGTDTVMTLFSNGTDRQVRPGGQYDDMVDLGKSTVRWKNLYLSGEIYAENSTKLLPPVTASDNDKFLRVVNGAWGAVTVPNASGVTF